MGVGATTWVRGGGTWSSGWVVSVGLVPLAAERTREDSVLVATWGAGRRCVFPQCGVGLRGHLGWCGVRGSFRDVAQVTV